MVVMKFPLFFRWRISEPPWAGLPRLVRRVPLLMHGQSVRDQAAKCNRLEGSSMTFRRYKAEIVRRGWVLAYTHNSMDYVVGDSLSRIGIGLLKTPHPTCMPGCNR